MNHKAHVVLTKTEVRNRIKRIAKAVTEEDTMQFRSGDVVKARKRLDAFGDTFQGAVGTVVDADATRVRVEFRSGVTLWVLRKDVKR